MDDHTLIDDFRIIELNIGVFFASPAVLPLPEETFAFPQGAWPTMEIVYTGGYLRYWVTLQ